MKTVDVGQVLDEGRWTAYQKLLIAGTALTISRALQTLSGSTLIRPPPAGCSPRVDELVGEFQRCRSGKRRPPVRAIRLADLAPGCNRDEGNGLED